jgi:hypothetical protein
MYYLTIYLKKIKEDTHILLPFGISSPELPLYLDWIAPGEIKEDK